MIPYRISVPFLILAALLTGSGFAHDLWLVPPPDRIPVGEPVEINVAVGMDFPVSIYQAGPDRLTMRAFGPGGSKAEVSLRKVEDELLTVASFVPNKEGSWIVSAVSKPNKIDLEAAHFNEYLLHDGMPNVLAKRMEDNELDRAATERYSKFTKALLSVGGSIAGGAERRALGLKLEILLLQNPFALRVGDTLRVQVLFDGEPLNMASLSWDHPGNGEAFSGQTWSDEKGKALIPVAKTGLMNIRLIHMTRPQKEEYEWESFWAAFTFRIPAMAVGQR